MINSSDFTIISNNCWGGFIYQSYNMKYNSPTVGLFFMAEDYINFLSNIKEIIYKPLEFINYTQSKYYNYYKDWDNFGKYPIGRFKDTDIEIHFLHYSSIEEVLNNWNRRVERINWNRIIYKFNDQNLCNKDHLKKFSELPVENKICFTSKKYNLPNTIYIKSSRKYSEIKASHEPFGNSKNININALINNL